MSNRLRSRNSQPFDFTQGLKARGMYVTCHTLSFATLREINITDLEINVCMIVMGGNTRGDSNKGIFYYDPTSVAADNNNTVIKPTQVGNDSGRWLKLGSIPN
jgi:hypothetical protein